jgi:hypothetical protein
MITQQRSLFDLIRRLKTDYSYLKGGRMKLRKCSFVGPISALILSVAGQLVNASPCDRWTLSGSDLYTATTGWEVGIGTTSPGAKLDVRGSAVFNECSIIKTHYSLA